MEVDQHTGRATPAAKRVLFKINSAGQRMLCSDNSLWNDGPTIQEHISNSVLISQSRDKLHYHFIKKKLKSGLLTIAMKS